MQILGHIFTPYTLPRYLRHCTTLEFSMSRTNSAWRHADTRGKLCHWANKEKRTAVLAVEDGNLATGSGIHRMRNIVEHICLFKAKEDLSEEEEKDMLDYLYTTQYQMRGILAISLGRISDQNPEQYTHAIFMRFQTKEDLAKFYENPFYMQVLKEHVMPYCHGFINLDYESEVEDDILPIFRKGEEFNYGVELVLLLAFIRSSLCGAAEDAMTSLANLTTQFPSLIVQATKGANMNTINNEYTHAVVMRFRSMDAFKIFMNSSEYITILWALNLCSKDLVQGIIFLGLVFKEQGGRHAIRISAGEKGVVCGFVDTYTRSILNGVGWREFDAYMASFGDYELIPFYV